MGKVGGVVGHCGDIVAGVLGLAQQLSADASGGSDDRELHGSSFFSRLIGPAQFQVRPSGEPPVAIARMTGT